jgi:hypothetical protein
MDAALASATGLRHRYRVPTSAVVAAALPAALIVVLWMLAGTTWWWYPVVMVTIGAVGVWFRRRQGLVLDDHGAHITVYRTRHLPWSDVVRFEPAARGGVSVVTDARSYRAVAPCSGWAARATDEQVAELERIRRSHQC